MVILFSLYDSKRVKRVGWVLMNFIFGRALVPLIPQTIRIVRINLFKFEVDAIALNLSFQEDDTHRFSLYWSDEPISISVIIFTSLVTQRKTRLISWRNYEF